MTRDKYWSSPGKVEASTPSGVVPEDAFDRLAQEWEDEVHDASSMVLGNMDYRQPVMFDAEEHPRTFTAHELNAIT